jgi:hypothetical protein
VGKPTGKYAVFEAEDAFKVPDAALAGERSRANEFYSSGKMKTYATSRYGLKSFIDEGDLGFMDGPFRLWERRKVETLVTKLELAQEKRVADAALGLSGRLSALSGEGKDAGKKWANASETAGGDRAADIRAAIAQMFSRPNLMVIPEAVYDAIEYHPRLLDKLGEANLIKKVDEENLAKLFRIDKVIIAKGKADFSKRNAGKNLTLSGIWGNNMVFAYTSGCGTSRARARRSSRGIPGRIMPAMWRGHGTRRTADCSAANMCRWGMTWKNSLCRRTCFTRSRTVL